MLKLIYNRVSIYLNKEGTYFMIKQINQDQSPHLWKWLTVIILVAAFLMGLCYQTQPAHAADITNEITGISGNDATYNGNKVDPNDSKNWDEYTSRQLTYKYSIKNGVSVKPGDTATLTLPANTKFHYSQSFDIFAADGKTVIGTFKADAGKNYGTITFNTYYQTNQNDRTGTINFPVVGTNPNSGGSGKPTIAKNGYAWDGSWPTNNDDYSKNSEGRYRYVEWDSLINDNKHELVNPTITDTFQDTDKQSFLPQTLLIQYNDSSSTAVPKSNYKVSFLEAV